MIIDDLTPLLEFCRPRQREIIEAVIANGGNRQTAATVLDIGIRRVFETLAAAKAQAAKRGYSPQHDLTRVVPDGFFLKGASTYYDKDGRPTGQWVKSSIDQDRQRELFDAAVAAMAESLPRLAATKPPRSTQSQLCTVYTLTDCHIGMRAWSKETLGDDWDLKIAEQAITSAMLAMLAAAPDAETGVVAQLGDWLHWDGMDAVTPTSRHQLDGDGRFGLVVKAAIRILRRVIDAALVKHKRVVLLVSEGNHDLASSVWVRNAFAALYERNKRLSVIDSELPYYVHQHGKTMVAWHHGHLKKNADLPLLMAAQFPLIWGSTTKRYCHVGHRHHVDIKEHSGMTVVQHATIAARDAYAARGGWISERQARAITYHSEFGEVGTVIVTPEMLDRAVSK